MSFQNDICYIHHRDIFYYCNNKNCVSRKDTLLCQKCYDTNEHEECKELNYVKPIYQKIDDFEENRLKSQASTKNLVESKKNLIFKKNIYIKKEGNLKIEKDAQNVIDQKNSENLMRNILSHYEEDFSKSKIIPMEENFLKIDKQLQEMRQNWIQDYFKPKNLERQIIEKTKSNLQSSSIQKQNKSTEKMMEIIQKLQNEEIGNNQQYAINDSIIDNSKALIQKENSQIQLEEKQENIFQLQSIDSSNNNSIVCQDKQLDFKSEYQQEAQFQIQQNSTSDQVQTSDVNQFKKIKQNVAYRKLDRIDILNNPLVKIEIIDSKILICFDQNNYIGLIIGYKYKKSQIQNKRVEQFKQQILDIQITEDKQILVLTVKGLLLLDYELKTLDELDEKIEINHLAICPMSKIKDVETNAVCYLKDSKKLIGIQISNNQIKQSFEQDLNLGEIQVLSMKVIKNNLYIGFQNGVIFEYELLMLTPKNTYKICNDLQNEFSTILFEEKFCLGIKENNLYRLDYGSQATILCSTETKIISCSYYNNQEQNKFSIHLLQEKQNIFVYSIINKEITKSKRLLKGRTCLKLYQDSKVYYGNQKGRVTIYHI
ncbi:unnamed protein product [Paramecium sonneborni]|uniref:Uncharacterized protein n=1 Tax=Paramecium sonneborni TaxID=65129 RepID=A0A8S1R5Z2_9CILI|nr:unnamed protein product [Paramecium sonneborni]